ncbi:hypothetical protein ACGFX2_39600 [Streptomyces goshikiensis]|uniref:hypothetical protein n=1 Tax=Streptomyces goshikiensis TaxID=1942 RepID=UPI00371A2C69
MTWGSAAGMILWSLLNATPYVADHLSPEDRYIAFVLPLVVDIAFVGSLRTDEIASRYGASGGAWAAVLRLFTGVASVFLNVGHSWEKSDWTGVCQHLIAPGILVLLAETGPVYRRRLAARLAAAEAKEAAALKAAKEDQQRQGERQRRLDQDEADRQAERDRQEAERLRLQKWEDQEKALELEERREAGRASRVLEAKRLELEEKRLQVAERQTSQLANKPAPQQAEPAPDPAPAPLPVRNPQQEALEAQILRTAAPTTVQRYGDPSYRLPAPAPEPQVRVPVAPRPQAGVPTASVAADHTGPARVTARVDHQEQPPAPQRPAAKDWDQPGLPAELRPGVAPALLTEEQSRARIVYGLSQEWTQRRIGEFAGRSATTVNKVKASLTSGV